MYAVVAPGIKGIYRSIRDVDEILKAFPYARFKKCHTEDECYEWIRTNNTLRKLEAVVDYGTAMKFCHIVMDYHLTEDTLYVNYDSSKFGSIRIDNDDPTVEVWNGQSVCAVKMPFAIKARPIQRHLLAICTALDFIGDIVDVVVKVPDHSIFYALRSYTGKDSIVCHAQDTVRSRRGGTSISLKTASPFGTFQKEED